MEIVKHTVRAHHDFELHHDLQREVDYWLYIPRRDIKGLVLYIAGFGEDTGAYRKKFQKYICSSHSMACLSVDYHCFFSRPNNGGSISIEPHIMTLLRTITGCTNNEAVITVLETLDKMKISQSPIAIPALICPQKQEYQNFGILPALDHIFTLNDVFNRYPNIPKTIYAIGSSYGGYIANIISKLAPSTLNAVFDNSSWAAPNMRYITGYELGYPEYVLKHSPNIVLQCNVTSPWSSSPFMPNGFNNDRQLIRSFPESHLDTMAQSGGNKTIYRFVHARSDGIANTEDKIALADRMSARGFDVKMQIYSEKDIDGRYVKTMAHGMNLSMQTFFSRCLDQTQSKVRNDQIIDTDFEHDIRYTCETKTYRISYNGKTNPMCSVS